VSLKYVITGMGHSGTGYAALLLRSAGVECGHEGVFTADGINRAARLEADSSWAAAAFLHDPICDDAVVVHIVRHPVAVIRSYLRGGWWQKNEEFIRSQVEAPMARSKMIWPIDCYWHWNNLIEETGRVTHRFRAEDRLQLLTLLGLEQQRRWDNPSYNHHPAKHNAPGNDREISWASLPDRVVEMAERYGYCAETLGHSQAPS
jgi:hypothetical protein